MPRANDGQRDDPAVSRWMPSAVPRHAKAIMPAKRRMVAAIDGPAANCQTFVTSEGTTTSAAACAGAMISPSAPIATVGSPMPTTPLTQPASTKTPAITTSCETDGIEYLTRGLTSVERHVGSHCKCRQEQDPERQVDQPQCEHLPMDSLCNEQGDGRACESELLEKGDQHHGAIAVWSGGDEQEQRLTGQRIRAARANKAPTSRRPGIQRARKTARGPWRAKKRSASAT